MNYLKELQTTDQDIIELENFLNNVIDDDEKELENFLDELLKENK